eukprot:181126-Pelagomonas_calceolata.AAC.2
MFARSASQTHPLSALTLQLHPQACRRNPGCALSAQAATCCELAVLGGAPKSAERSADGRERLSNDI